jgi:cell division protein FtsN
MPRDYKSRAQSRQQKKSLPGYVWLLSGLAIGLFIAFIIYLDKQPENEKDFGTAVQQELEKLKQQAKKPDHKKTNPVTEDETNEKKEQKFNFYTLLPELEILIPEDETRPPETEKKSSSHSSSKPASTRAPASNKRYVLQVGSFQNLDDAEKLKANLAFLGLSASIQHVRVKNQTWHRVRTGPYKDREQLYKRQKILKKNNLQGIPMELK